MKSYAGHFLVASPYLRDPNFARTVVLMLQHESQGALGVILNRPGGKTIHDVWEMIEGDPCDSGELVHVGGPVPGPLIAIHDQRQFAEKEVLPRLYMSMQRDTIDKLVRKADARFRLFSGHAGWGAGQLDGELQVGGWLTAAATAEEVFSDPETIWKDVCGKIGRGIVAADIPEERMPTDPSVN